MEGNGFVKCILPRPLPYEPKQAHVTGREDMVMQLFYLGDKIRISDVMAHLNISRSTAIRILNELLESGHIQRVGEGAATCYIIREP